MSSIEALRRDPFNGRAANALRERVVIDRDGDGKVCVAHFTGATRLAPLKIAEGSYDDVVRAIDFFIDHITGAILELP